MKNREAIISIRFWGYESDAEKEFALLKDIAGKMNLDTIDEEAHQHPSLGINDGILCMWEFKGEIADIMRFLVCITASHHNAELKFVNN